MTCDRDDIKVLVAWKEPGVWFVEAHNPTDEEAEVRLVSDPNWTPFRFDEAVRLAPGSSKVWDAVKEDR